MLNKFLKLSESKYFLPILLTIGFIIRLIFAWHEQNFQSPDFEYNYSRIAENFVDGKSGLSGQPPRFCINLDTFCLLFSQQLYFPCPDSSGSDLYPIYIPNL